MAAPEVPMASVPTGTPRGIWTIESSESTPLSALLSTGTPSTGRIEIAASIPGRWAAPPAPAMITSRPRPSASRPYRNSRSGVRCAETTFVSCGMPSSVSTSAACRIVSQSDLLPITTPTRGDRGISGVMTMSPSLRLSAQIGLIGSPTRIAPPSRIWARKPAAVHQGFAHAASRQRLQVLARLAEPDAPEHHLADPELLADQVVQRDAPGHHVAPGLDRAELDAVVPAHRLDRLGLDQRELAVRPVLARRHPLAAELPVPFQPVPGHRDDLVDRLQRLFRRRADEQGHDRRAR